MKRGCPGPIRIGRRDVLQVGAIGLFGLSLPRLLYAQEHARRTGTNASADACILIFLNGGPSHLDMWDMKPAAPVEIRGEFRPIATTVPGIQLSDQLPRLARQMHHCTLVRSMYHSVNNAHAAAVYVGLTGHDRGDANIAIGAGPNDYPAIGSVVGLCRPPRTSVVPYVSMPYITQEGRGGPPQPGFFGGWLGRNHDPLFVLRDPNAADFGMPELSLGEDVSSDRLRQRRRLEGALSGPRADRRMQELGSFQARAVDLLTSAATRRAFQLDQEPAALRDAYGRNTYGQSVLLSRRLIEAGTRVACISWAPDANATWDTHAQNFTKLKRDLLPQLDLAVGTLLGDLAARGLLERTLVAVMGEFGRTPRVNNDAGRDHYPNVFSAALAGGPVKGGRVIGESDSRGAFPRANPKTPQDVLATMYRHLGIDVTVNYTDGSGRPHPVLPSGRPIEELS